MFFYFSGSQISRSPVSRFLNLQISRFLDFQIPRFPDAAGTGATGAGRTLRSQPDPFPNAPRDQIRRKEPLLRLCVHKRSVDWYDGKRQCSASTNHMQGARASWSFWENDRTMHVARKQISRRRPDAYAKMP